MYGIAVCDEMYVFLCLMDNGYMCVFMAVDGTTIKDGKWCSE